MTKEILYGSESGFASLQAEVDALKGRLAALERALSSSPARGTSPQGRRRRLLNRINIVAGALALALIIPTALIAFTGSGVPLLQVMEYSTPPASQPPLDTMVRWGRRDPVGVGPAYTNQILSLVAEGTQRNSFTWPLYIQLSATNDPTATMASSQSVGATVRAYNRSTGNPWLAGYHSEIYHGMDGLSGATVDAHGTSILFNGEMTNTSSAGTTIGLNLQATGASTAGSTHAINIQSGGATGIWQNGIHFEGSGLGNIGINLDQAHYNMGLDLADNSMRMNANQKIVLEKYGAVFIRYNSSNGRVEIVKGYDRVVASF